MRQLAAIIILAGVARAQSGLSLLPPDAGGVIGIDWRRMVDSPVGAQLKEQIAKTEMGKQPAFQSAKDSLFQDIDSVVISIPASALRPGGATNPPALVVVKGRFELARLRSMLGSAGTAEKYRAVDMLVAPKTAAVTSQNSAQNSVQTSVIALLDANTILAGDRTFVHAAIDRVKLGRLTKSHTGVLAGVAELAAANDIWMILTIPPGAVKDVPPQMAKMFSDLRSAELGMSFREGLALQMSLLAKDDAAAGAMAQMVQGLLAVAAMSQSDNPQAADLMRKLRIAPEGPRVKLALSLSQSELEAMVKQAQAQAQAQAARPSGPSVSGLAGRPARPANNGIRPQAPPSPNTVRITGLDGGPVEVPIKK